MALSRYEMCSFLPNQDCGKIETRRFTSIILNIIYNTKINPIEIIKQIQKKTFVQKNARTVYYDVSNIFFTHSKKLTVQKNCCFPSRFP